MDTEIESSTHNNDNTGAYIEACESDVARSEWVNNYSENPVVFFSEENIKKLKDAEGGVRMLWFTLSLSDIRVTPELAQKYFEEFPEDLESFGSFIKDNHLPSNSREFNLWAICSGLVGSRSDQENLKPRRSQYLEIHERRKLAPKHLLSNYKHRIFDDIKSLGDVPKGFLETFDVANAHPMGLEKTIDVSLMYAGKEYIELDDQKKLEYLQLCLSALQYSLVFHEVNNSAFTPELVNRLHGSAHHNVAHSMLFNTFQPSVAYNLGQRIFDYEMDNTAARGGLVEEYPFHRMIIETLKEISKIKDQTPKTTEMLVEFWDKNRNPIFANSVTDAITSQDINIGARELLKRIKGNSQNKNALSAILYRLEFGRLNISSGGVKYLERVYDLGDYNDPSYFVSRLTSQGDVGIFGEDEKLLRYFNLGDLSTDEGRVKAAVYDFVYTTLFVAPPGETPDMRQAREKYLKEFKAGYLDFKDVELCRDDRIRLDNLSFKEQAWLFVVWKDADDAEKKQLVDFASAFHEEGMKLFLLLNEKDKDIKNIIFKLSSEFGKDDAKLIFNKISQILQFVGEVDEWALRANEERPQPLDSTDTTYMKRLSEWEDAKRLSDSGLIQKIQIKILDRVQKILSSANLRDILNNLDNVSSEAVLAQSMILSNREDTGFSINDLPEMALYTGEGYTIGDAEAKKIRDIYCANYKDRPRMLEKLLEGFESSRKKENAEFHTMYFKDELVGVVVFEYDRDQVYFGKFNIDPKFQGGKIGEQMMEETLDRIARQHIVSATCSKGAPVTPKYIERGFVAEGEFTFEEDECFNIVRNDSKNDMFISKSLDEDFIVDHAQYGYWTDFEDGKCKMLLTKADRLGERMFPELADKEDGFKWVMTRFFKVLAARPEDNMVCYVVEKVSDVEFNEYKNFVDQPRVIISDHALIF